jgi:hypothetical protein
MVLAGGVGCAKLVRSSSISANRLSSFKELSVNAPIRLLVEGIGVDPARGAVDAVGILLCIEGVSKAVEGTAGNDGAEGCCYRT